MSENALKRCVLHVSALKLCIWCGIGCDPSSEDDRALQSDARGRRGDAQAGAPPFAVGQCLFVWLCVMRVCGSMQVRDARLMALEANNYDEEQEAVQEEEYVDEEVRSERD